MTKETNMARFWTHPGASFVVNVEHVTAAFAEGSFDVVFFFVTGQLRTSYKSEKERNEALQAFSSYVAAGSTSTQPGVRRV